MCCGSGSTAAHDGNLYLWNLRTGRVARTASRQAPSRDVAILDASHLGDRGGGPPAAASSAVASAALAALATVRDPELDEPITTLGFVSSCTVSPQGQAQIRLRLPTYFCAPNFAFLMVADAYDAVTAVPGVVVSDSELESVAAS